MGTLVLAQPGPVTAQEADADQRTVWDGVYTAEQSERGRSHFQASCSSCHQPQELAGEAFFDDWGEDYLFSLFDLIRTSMPASAPASLPDEAYLEIVTYLLELNEFPSGEQPLDSGALTDIRVERADGPGEVPEFSLVEITGCLARDPAGNWIVTAATAPVRTRDPTPATDDEREALLQTPLGTGLFELLYVFPSPDAFEGHRVEVIGLLIRESDPDRINVSAVSSLAPECDSPSGP